MSFGLDVPFYSYAEVVEKFEDDISDSDRETLFELSDQYNEMVSDEEFDYESSAYETLIDKIEAVFDRNGLPGKEISTQV